MLIMSPADVTYSPDLRGPMILQRARVACKRPVKCPSFEWHVVSEWFSHHPILGVVSVSKMWRVLTSGTDHARFLARQGRSQPGTVEDQPRQEEVPVRLDVRTRHSTSQISCLLSCFFPGFFPHSIVVVSSRLKQRNMITISHRVQCLQLASH